MYQRIIRWAFDRFYHEFAWTYDLVAALVSAGHWRDWTLAALPWLRGSVLELGCGTGNLQLALARSTAIGLDRSPQMLSLAQHKIRHAGFFPRLTRADIRQLPFAEASFDSIVATFPSEYIVSEAALREIRRVLRTQGRVVVVLSAQLGRENLYTRLVDLLYRLTLQRSARAQSAPAAASVDVVTQRLVTLAAQLGIHFTPRWVEQHGDLILLLVGEAN